MNMRGIFPLVSLAVHGIALLGFFMLGENTGHPVWPPSGEFRLVEFDMSPLPSTPANNIRPAVQPVMPAAKQVHRTAPPAPTVESPVNLTSHTATVSAAQSVVAQDNIIVDATEPESAPSASTAPARSIQEMKAMILSYLRLTLDLQKTYPPLAHRYGWQGDVLLAFHIDPSGAIQNVHVTHSSGYALLDQSAVNALRRVGSIPNASGWLHDGMTDLELPVSYQLRES